MKDYTQLFYNWENRGRGWMLYNTAVDLEPPCEPFIIPSFQDASIDDGRVPSILSSIKNLFTAKNESETQEKDESLYPFQAYLDNQDKRLKSIQISLSTSSNILLETSEQFLHILAATEHQISYEILATSESVTFQFTCSETDYSYLIGQVKLYFPEMAITEVASGSLPFNTSTEIGIVDLGLEQEYFRPIKELQRIDPDPYLGFLGACENLLQGEVAMLQVLFKGSRNPWAFITLDAVSDGRGGSFFIDAPEAPTIAHNKTSRPVYSVIVRVAAQGINNDRTQEILEKVTNALVIQTRSSLNNLIPLSNEGYSYSDHLSNVFDRKSNRLGMLLNSGELTTLVHVPSLSISSPKLSRQVVRTKSVPKELMSGKYILGVNEHIGITTTATIDDEHRLRHTHVIGATGVGKSTFLVNLFLQDVNSGNGCAIIDPHGDTIDDIIVRIPEDRLPDVILIDPSDTEFPVGFNLFQATTEVEKIVLSSDLLETFKARSTSWGDNMTSVLANAINAFLESEQGGTLLDLKRFLVDTTFRNQFLKSVSDPSIRYYWAHDFNQLKKGSISPLLTRLDAFLRPRIIRNMMAQKGGLNFNEILNERKIVLVKLAQGLIGEDNSYVLGSLFLAKLYQAAQARQALSKQKRTPFYLYIDEFHHFITPTLSGILSGARKYGLGLTLAHQEMNQVMAKDSGVGNAVLSNPGIRVCFRLGDLDAKRLESGFQSFDHNDLQNLGVGEAIARVGRSDYDFNLRTYPLSTEVPSNNYHVILTATRRDYGLSKDEVEKNVEQILGTSYREYEKAESVLKDSSAQQKVLSTEEVLEQQASKNITESAKEYVEEAKKSREQREHTYLQEYVKRLAEQRGFNVTLEYPTKDGGRIDVVMVYNEIRVACEVSVTNTVDYEVQNIQKCISCSFANVIVICQNVNHLNAIKKNANQQFLESGSYKLYFIPPSELANVLDELILNVSQAEFRIRGYRVKTVHKPTNKTPNSASSVHHSILQALRRTSK